ncbi:hypothetical protein [Pseudoalteromonas sp. SR44-2]|uniref:hypothetical protein n=1 Tax=Pseudoalteromonas sp. SR44-2 TaxID=2760937 RepID=UPI001600E85D|nr:hypothetical protein [Pseudoalteromonas sp. SR44-2]MBB1339440.1 hypothetical protein [Pseudoalteromonas sp. SR44-2]
MALHLSDLRFQIYNAGLLGVGKEALKQGAKSGFYISVFFSVTLNSISWLFEEDYRWTNWLATTSTDIVKAVLGAIGGILFGLLIAVVAISAGIIVGVGISILLNQADIKLKITESLIKYLEQREKEFMRRASINIGEELRRVYLVTTESIVKSVKIKVKKELNGFINELVNPW